MHYSSLRFPSNHRQWNIDHIFDTQEIHNYKIHQQPDTTPYDQLDQIRSWQHLA